MGSRSRKPALAITDTALLEALGVVSNAVSKDGYRQVLGATLFEITVKRGKPASVRLVGADNYRIAWFDLPEQSVTFVGKPATFLLPLDGLTALLRDVKPSKYGPARPVTFTLSAHATVATITVIEVAYADWTRTFTAVDGKFPDYAKVIPTRKPKYRFGIDGAMLAELAKAIAGPKDARHTLVVEITGDPLKPITFRAHGKSDRGEVLMPVRIAEPKPVPAPAPAPAEVKAA